MKKILISSLLLGLSASAYASTARLLALGMNEVDNDGVYHIQDSRNIFLNPAQIHHYTDFAALEYGNVGSYASFSQSVSTGVTVTKSDTPKAMGGYFQKVNDNIFGIYLGNESNTSSMLRAAASSAAAIANGFGSTYAAKTLHSTDNQVDLFWGSQAGGMKYAFDVIYGNGKDEARSAKNSAIALRSGVLTDNWEAHINLSLNSKANTTDTVNPLGVGSTSVSAEFKGKLGLQVGGSYNLTKTSKVFGYYKRFSWEQTDSYSNYGTFHTTAQGSASASPYFAYAGQNGTISGDFTAYYLGWGDAVEVNGGDNVFYSLTAKKTDINLGFTNRTEVRHLVIPVTVGYEAKALEWLTLRGSIVQNLYGTKNNKNESNVNPFARSLVSAAYGTDGKASITNSTAINAGASLVFGNLSVDSMIGLSNTGSTGSSTSQTNTTSKLGILAFDNLLTTVGLNYKF